METNMKQSESTYYDIPERKECIKLWRDVGNSDILKPGPYKGVDLVCDKYNIEVAWSHKKENPSPHPWPDGPLEYRLEDRKLRYWIDEDFNHKPTHYVCFLKDMDKAVEAIINHRDNGNKLMIFGDYDVDGVSSTAMLCQFFKSINIDVSYYIPHRDIDGYGLSKRGIDFANSIGSTLIITCDCGINAFDQIEYAMGMEIDVIVTDHHKPEEKIPNCIAVINPNREDCSYPFNGLCGAGVAFKLALAIADTISVDLDMVWKYADIVTLGIAADIVPMIDENRIISYFGLKQIKGGNNLGIRSLIDTSKLQMDRIGIGQITFWVTPKINAAGRLGEASRAVKLLSSNNQVNAVEIAKALDKENEKRKLITLNMENESLSMIENDPEFNKKYGIVLFKENWHSGVIGIVASRIKEIPSFSIELVTSSSVTGNMDGVSPYGAANVTGASGDVMAPSKAILWMTNSEVSR